MQLFGTTGQAKNLAKGPDGPGQTKFRTGRARTNQIREQKWCCKTEIVVLKQEKYVLKQENDVQKQKIYLVIFLKNFNLFCAGTSWDRGVCLGTFSPALVPRQRDTRQDFFFVPRQRDNGTSRPVNYLIWNVQYSKASLSSCLYKCLRLYGKCFTPSLTKMTGGPRWAYNIMDLVNISFIFLIVVLSRIFGWKWQSVKWKYYL